MLGRRPRLVSTFFLSSRSVYDAFSSPSSIHDHANSHCFMRVLDGSLQEVQYVWPDCSSPRTQPISELGTHDVLTDEVTYINGMCGLRVAPPRLTHLSLPADSIGLHRIQNTSHTDPAVSLHLYSPPITACHTYEQRTGRAHSCNVTFFSKAGTLCTNYSTCSPPTS